MDQFQLVSQFLTRLAKNKLYSSFNFDASEQSFINNELEGTVLDDQILVRNLKSGAYTSYQGEFRLPQFAHDLVVSKVGKFEDKSIFHKTIINGKAGFITSSGKRYMLTSEETRITTDFYDLLTNPEGQAALMFLPSLYPEGDAPSTSKASNVLSSARLFSFPGDISHLDLQQDAELKIVDHTSDSTLFSLTQGTISQQFEAKEKGSDFYGLLQSFGLHPGLSECHIPARKVEALVSACTPILSEKDFTPVTVVKSQVLLSNLVGDPKLPSVPVTVISAHFDAACPVFKTKELLEKYGITYYMTDTPDKFMFHLVRPELIGPASLLAFEKEVGTFENLSLESANLLTLEKGQ